MRLLAGAVVLLAAVASAGLVHAAAETRVPDAATWRAAAAAGAELALPVGGRTAILLLNEDTDLFEPGARPDGVVPFEGTVAGGGWVRGAVKGDTVVALAWSPSTGLVSVGPRDDGSLAAVRDAAATVSARGIDTVIEPEGNDEGGGGGVESCDSLLWQPQIASPTTLLEDDALRTFDVALAVDSSYATAIPDWEAGATAAIAAVDQLYRSAFQIRISIVHLIEIPDIQVPGQTTVQMLDSLQAYYLEHHPGLVRENVHLMTGRDPTNAAGQVNCVGSVGRTTVSYSVSQGIPGGPYDYPGGLLLLPDGAMKIAAHELAHTLSAHHHYANCAEPASTFDPFVTLDLCTVMINDWGLIAPVFSSLEKLTVRGWADYYDV